MGCSQTAGPEVLAIVQKSTLNRNTVASKLVVVDFALFDAHDDDGEPIWLGKVVTYPSWNGHGVYVNDTQKMPSLMVCRLVEEKWGFMSCGMKKRKPWVTGVSTGYHVWNESPWCKTTAT